MEEKSTFNMSLATLERIDMILKDLKHYGIIKNIPLIIRNLQYLYKEIRPFLNPDERKQSEKEWDSLLINLDNNRGSILRMIDNYENDLREQLLKKGLLMATPDDPHMAIQQ